uniref:Secreted protein n=1 Tax=Knipowitschia caucasica TaxID=637954 RepID=A0AAV2MQ30_KNICA
MGALVKGHYYFAAPGCLLLIQCAVIVFSRVHLEKAIDSSDIIPLRCAIIKPCVHSALLPCPGLHCGHVLQDQQRRLQGRLTRGVTNSASRARNGGPGGRLKGLAVTAEEHGHTQSRLLLSSCHRAWLLKEDVRSLCLP